MAAVARPGQHSTADTTLSAAIEGFFAAGDLAAETRKVYEATLMNLEQDLPAEIALVQVDRQVLAEHLKNRYGTLAPATYNRNRATICSLFAWCVETGLIIHTPTRGIRRRKQRRTVGAKQQRPISADELTALWSDRRHPLRDRVFWAMAYDTAARADELLRLNIENINVENREAVIIGKDGSTEQINWTAQPARLLPRLIAGRKRGPLFVGARKPRSHLPPAAENLCEVTGKARLSYRRAEEIWKRASGGRTLHQLRHSKLTHLSEAGQDATAIQAKSRHKSLRSLERYAKPSPAAIRDLTSRHDLTRRNRGK